MAAGKLVERARSAGFKGSKPGSLSAKIEGARVYLSLVSFRSDGLGGPAMQMTVTAIPPFPPIDEADALGLCTVPVPIPDRDITRTPFGLFSRGYPETGDRLNDNPDQPLSWPAGYMRYGERNVDEMCGAVERWFDGAMSWAAGYGPAQVIDRIEEYERIDTRARSSISKTITGGIRLAALTALGRVDEARQSLDSVVSIVNPDSPNGRSLLSLLARLEEHLG